MTDTITGGCLCGAVRYETDAEPAGNFLCHCRDCQKANGSAFTTGFVVPRDSLRLQGQVAEYTVDAASGRKITRQFCPTCGSALFTLGEGFPDKVVIKVGTLDDNLWFEPSAQLWTQSQLPFANIEEGKRHPRGRDS